MSNDDQPQAHDAAASGAAPAGESGASNAPQAPEASSAPAETTGGDSGGPSPDTSGGEASSGGGGPRGDGEKPRKKRRRRKKKPGDAPAPKAPAVPTDAKSPADLIQLGLTALGSAYVDLKRRAGGARLGHEGSDSIELSLPIPLRRGFARQAAEDLVKRLREDLEKRVMDAGLVVPGRVWNFATESFDSDWSKPEDPRHVLVGFGLEGRPRWADLVTLAIERKHDSVEQLLAGREGAVAFVERGDAVTEGVKPAFDPEAIPFRIVGQLVCGLFESSEAGRRVALTIQVLASNREGEAERLICHAVSAVDLADLPDPSVRKILKNFDGRLAELAKQLEGKRAAGETPDVSEAVLPLLRELSRRLSHDAKNRSRKTDHARDRGDEGRPTAQAFPEARSARDHHLYMDNEEQTIVVVGKKGRIHVFSPDGRHVTSVVMPPANVRQRVKSGRWRLAEAGERGSFREALSNKDGASEGADA